MCSRLLSAHSYNTSFLSRRVRKTFGFQFALRLQACSHLFLGVIKETCVREVLCMGLHCIRNLSVKAL